MATIADIASKAGVGVGTVSRVLNHSPLVSEATRRRVQLVIQAMDYQPSEMARRFSLGRTSTIGVIAPFFTSASVVERLRGVTEALHDAPYDLTIFNVDSPVQRIEQLQQLAHRGRADGVIDISLPLRDDEAQRFRDAGVPIVLIDVAHPLLPHVVIDDLQGGAMAARHLIDLGHQRIAFIGDPSRNAYGFTSSRNRRAGFERALSEAQLLLRPEYLKEGPHDRHVAHRLTNELLALPEPPTAIFAASDTQALGVLEAARNAHVAIPGNLSVIGFDDIEVAPYVGLTTIRQPLYASGVRGVELLLDILSGTPLTPLRETFSLELVVRQTTGPVIGRTEYP